MPTYQYACTNPECGERFELVQSFTDPAASQCPVCDGPVRKVFSAVGVVFKGSGFYRTDNRPKESSGSSKDSGGDSGSKSGSDTKQPAAAGAGKQTSSGSSSSGSSSSGGSSSGGTSSDSSSSGSSGSSSGKAAASA